MTQTTQNTLRLERKLAAPIDKVWHAFTDATMLAKWFAPGPMTAEVHEADVRVGGGYEITMHGDEGSHTCYGTYTKVEPPSTLEMTFNWKGDGAMPADTTVTVRLTAQGDSTHLDFQHSGFPNPELVQHHTSGWEACIAALETILN